MRTVLYGICLFNDADQIKRTHFYIKRIWRGRKQDSGETERVCVRDCTWGKGEIASVIKLTVREIHLARSNVGLICEINNIPERH
jgi:hypothetical protein